MSRLNATLVVLLCSFGFCSSALSASNAAGDSTDSPSPTSSSDDPREKGPSAWKVAIYPIYVWAPIFGAHIDIPSLPPRPGTAPPPDQSGNASGSFNGAFFSAVEIQKSGWSGSANFMYASVSGENSNPRVDVSTRVVFGQAMGGRRIVDGLSLEGGVRRMALKITASTANSGEVSSKPGIWDPLIGMTWRHQAGRKWNFQLHADGGGFGVGSDVALGAAGRADWRFSRHFGLAMGFAAIHFQISSAIRETALVQRKLEVRQTLYGPIFGFGIYF